MRGSGVYAFGARTKEFIHWGRDERFWVYAFGASTTPLHRRRKSRDWRMRGSGVYAFGARTKEFIHWGRDETFWGLRLRSEDSTTSSTEEEPRRIRGSGVYAFGARTKEFIHWGRDERFWVYAFGARTKRVYPLRKRRDVLGSAPSGRGQHQFADWGKCGIEGWGISESTPSGRGKHQFADWGRGEIEGWRVLGVYAFGARTAPIRWLRKRRDRRIRDLESTPSGRGRHDCSHWWRDEWFRGLRLRCEDNTTSSTEGQPRLRDERFFTFGQHEFIHGGRDERFWGLRLGGEDSTNSLIEAR
jgi:hypothetical protein